MTRSRNQFDNAEASEPSKNVKGDNPLLPSIKDIKMHLKAEQNHAGSVMKTEKHDWKPTLERDINDFNMLHDDAITRMVNWTASEGTKLGLIERKDGQPKEINAFRHVVTAAVYKLKYGNLASKILADINERRHLEWFSHMGERADSYADRCNNQIGFKIAEELDALRRKGNKVTVEEVVKKAYAAIKAGQCVTNPRETYEQYLRKIEKEPEEIHYRGMD